MHNTVLEVTQRIVERSRNSRDGYVTRMQNLADVGVQRQRLSCGNLAHGFAACQDSDKQTLRLMQQANIAIVSAYNDMLSAHQPYQHYPERLKKAVRAMGSVAQFAGGVPAMCDGVTQGQDGMELSLFSRDTIAMSTAIALSHNMFDGALCLGICDKIVPGLMIGALSFGHLPFVFVPAGPMPSGIANKEKARVRQLFAEGKATREELLSVESASYHSPGTCTFYGTANSNQMLIEVMGLQLPGSAFVNPEVSLRDTLTDVAAERVVKMTRAYDGYMPLHKIVDEKSIVNALVALLATGGSTNHTMHWVAIARAAGIQINWDDFDALSKVTPLLTRIYPNGEADINHFQAAGGTAFLIRELLQGGLLHPDVNTVMGPGLQHYTQEPFQGYDNLTWKPGPTVSGDTSVLRPVSEPFDPEGGLKVVSGNLGRGIAKISAVQKAHRVVEAPAVVLHDQHDLQELFESGQLDRDCVVVVRFQGPAAIGMPELHKLTPYLGVLQDRGFKVALVTDGRMSGASGKVLAAIHVYPEAAKGGPLAKVKDGDLIRVDGEKGELSLLVDTEEWQNREPAEFDRTHHHTGMGRELFSTFRQTVGDPESGAAVFLGADL
ncbi:MAG: phosphogluconate dehydratase [Pseudomonadales bacterium]|nr:phosphogluconate dehydratase [Pseudomonadales bacterium]